MSGIEVTGLAFGVLPVLVEVLRSYDHVADVLKTLKRPAREYRKLETRFMTSQHRFKAESQLLFDSTQRRADQISMLSNYDDEAWKDRSLDEAIRVLLDNQAEVVKMIIESIKSCLEKLMSQLGPYRNALNEEELDSQSTPSLTEQINRAYKSAQFALDTSRIGKEVDRIREQITELTAIREQGWALRRLHQHDELLPRKCRTPLRHLNAIKRASEQLHHAISEAWCCTARGNGEHHVKLMVEPVSLQPEVCLDLLISCGPGRLDTSSRPVDPPLRLRVRPETGQLNESAKTVPNQHPSAPETSLARLNRLIDKLRWPKRETTSQPGKSPYDLSTGPAEPNGASRQVDAQGSTTRPCDLRINANTCQYLKQQMTTSACQVSCLGFLEAYHGTQLRKCLFYAGDTVQPSTGPPSFPESHPLSDLLRMTGAKPPLCSKLLFKYQLALRTAKSALQFYSTAWMRPAWQLRDLSVFGSEISEETLETLHVSAHIERRARAGALPSTTAHSTVQSTASVPTTNASHRKPNEALFSLGIALLEIGYWEPLRSMQRPGDLDDVDTALRKVADLTYLVSSYRRVVDRCLRCDFGAGKDLGDIQLQHAVMEGVIGPLELLVSASL